MAIKWPSLYPQTQFWCKKLCMELNKVIKQIWLKYVEYLQRYWHLQNLRLTRYSQETLKTELKKIDYYNVSKGSAQQTCNKLDHQLGKIG
jgi:hypothetical protein